MNLPTHVAARIHGAEVRREDAAKRLHVTTPWKIRGQAWLAFVAGAALGALARGWWFPC